MSAVRSLRTGHVGLNVTDVDRSVDFYTTVFGFEVVAEGKEAERRFTFLGSGGVPTLTLWQQSTGGHATNLAGLHHLSFQVDSIEEVEAAEQVLRGIGAEFAYDGVVPHGEGAASGGIFFTDPDGIRLEIYTTTAVDGTDAPTSGAPTCGFF
ncbi:VOC family protein [Solihabitans fulvus]|uniref:VOC family protein n=1 Tax=Solihabitans fulvus TaxID=1892852 RepID=A0A5B2XGC8_9PSEU|nr:VOC family protein [Solihabitans fulvus]KAA2261930.1 VOC family protein [Solihabitans fulvus]